MFLTIVLTAFCNAREKNIGIYSVSTECTYKIFVKTKNQHFPYSTGSLCQKVNSPDSDKSSRWLRSEQRKPKAERRAPRLPKPTLLAEANHHNSGWGRSASTHNAKERTLRHFLKAKERSVTLRILRSNSPHTLSRVLENNPTRRGESPCWRNAGPKGTF